MDEYLEFFRENPLLIFGFLIVLGLIIWTEFNRLTRKYTVLNVNEAVKLLNNDETVCLDVREEREMKDGIIQNSRHVPLAKLQDCLKEYNNAKEKPFLIVCRGGNRANHASSTLTKNGFTNVSSLAGGILAWESANLPLTKK